ncbi:hypothetical protein [Amaricoccus sp.]|uniref:hypothetical protein n=1 Tax=Amaricoccus sp. TaxID=1872485 RepID=UPI001B4B37E5|nr:hypothetical protein [Amaricoccus sp.]MBP7240925.1 hypothetical protein [Amaricoccus sp.]
MIRGLLAGAAVAGVLLAAGTVLGALRVLVAAPRLGEGWALALELPAMLAIAWTATGRFLRRLAAPGALADRLAMSAALLLVLFAGEAALAAGLAGASPAAWLAGLADSAAWPGLAAQIAAGLMPLWPRRH